MNPLQNRRKKQIGTNGCTRSRYGRAGRAAAMVLVALCLGAPGTSEAQVPAPPPSETQAIGIDSGSWLLEGSLAADLHRAELVFADIVSVNDAPWMRLSLEGTELAGRGPQQHGAFLRIESMHDGAVQYLDATSLAQWDFRSAYFNGSDLLVELYVYPGMRPSRLRVNEVEFGKLMEGGLATICGSTDERELSDDPRDARMNNGCSAFLTGESCMLSAGHCSGATAVEFNVPMSSFLGNWNFAHPDDQYAIDPESKLAFQNGCNNEGMHFGVFPNSNTGLTPRQAYGDGYVIADSAPSAFGSPSVRVRGYGSTTETNLPNSWNSVQKEHVGPLTQSFGSVIRYQVDTTGGNSGSAVILESTGEVIGIHTCGGCGPSFGANNGTSIQNSNLQNILENPAGICIDDLPPQPSNNDCSNSIFLGDGQFEISNLGATGEGMPESDGCAAQSAQADVWYSYLAGCSGTLTVDVCDADFEAVVSIYGGTCPTAGEEVISCSSAACGAGGAISIPVSQGDFFRIRIGSADQAQGEATLSITCAPAPIDQCSGDLNDDGAVDVFDMLALLDAWGSCGKCPEDLTGSGVVDVFDLLELLEQWGSCD